MAPKILDARLESLRARLPRPTDPPLREGYTEAAVSVILRSRDPMEVLLIKRSEAESDPWSGHMALPGGKRDEGDSSLLHTAVRETLEETGVTLGTGRSHLGRLSRVDPATRRLPPLTITPFVFGVPANTVAAAANHEVERVFWIPLSTFRAPSAAGTFEYRTGDLVRRFPAFHVAGEVVWGLTYRVLEEFLQRILLP